MKILIVLVLVFGMNAFAQVISLKGKIIDSETERPLENANITIKGNERFGVVSDLEGLFTLLGDFNPDNIVEVS